MNQLIVKTFGSADAVRGYASALRRSTAKVSAGLDDKDILKIDDQSGEWFFGQENTVVERDDVWAVNPVSFVHGYIAFDGKEVAEDVDGERAEILLPITSELPDAHDLPELDIRSKRRKDEAKPSWKFQLGVNLVCVEGANKGAEVVYKPTSMGGLRAMRKLSEEIARRLDTDAPDAIVPIVELDSKSYHNKRWGKDIHNPVLHILEWETLDANEFNSEERDEEPKSSAQSRSGKSGKSDKGGRDRDSDDGKRGRGAKDDARERAVEDRKSERTAKGDKVDNRRSARDEEDDGDADDKVVPLERGRRGRREDAAAEETRAAPRGRRSRDEEVDEEREEAPRGRRAARERGEDDAEEDRAAPRGRRGRDEEEDRPVRAGRAVRDEDAPRGRRSR